MPEMGPKASGQRIDPRPALQLNTGAVRLGSASFSGPLDMGQIAVGSLGNNLDFPA